MTVTLSASSFSDIVKNIFFVPGRMRLLVIIASNNSVMFFVEKKQNAVEHGRNLTEGILSFETVLNIFVAHFLNFYKSAQLYK